MFRSSVREFAEGELRPRVEQMDEAAKLDPRRTLCIFGADEQDSLCPQLAPASVEALQMPGGHHFGGNYAPLAQLVVGAGVQPH